MDLGQLPADLWTERLPADLRDRAPHIEERDGQAVWICDGKVWGTWGGKPPATGDQRAVKPIYNALDRGGIFDQSERRPAVADLRLQDMDRDSVETQVIFGPIFQISTDDPVLREACYRVYNDWLMEFCAAAPNRLIGVPMLPETDPAAAHAELLRLAKKGGVGQVCLMCAQANPKFDDPAWEKLWDALEETGIILSWHITVFGVKPGDRAAGKAAGVFKNTKGFLNNFLEECAAMALIPFFGDGHLLWASDYPPPDSVWPNSRAAIERQMQHLSPEMRRKLTHDNAAKLYGLG